MSYFYLQGCFKQNINLTIYHTKMYRKEQCIFRMLAAISA